MCSPQQLNCLILPFFFQAEDGIRAGHVTGVQTCALPICRRSRGVVRAPVDRSAAATGRRTGSCARSGGVRARPGRPGPRRRQRCGNDPDRGRLPHPRRDCRRRAPRGQRAVAGAGDAAPPAAAERGRTGGDGDHRGALRPLHARRQPADPSLGATAVAALRVGRGRLLAPAMLPRRLRLSVAGLAVTASAEGPFALFTLAGSPPSASVTGWFLGVRTILLVSLVAVVATGWWLGQGGLLRARVLAVLLAAGLVLATAWSAVSVAMTRVRPPQYYVHASIAEVYLGFETPLPPTAQVLFTQWRPNVLFGAMAALAVGLYLCGTWRLHRRGDRWPVGRTLAWVLGWLTVVLATSSGFGRYSGPDFGVHMVGHMALNMLAPGLLVLGGPLTLALRTRSGRGRAGLAPGTTSRVA